MKVYLYFLATLKELRDFAVGERRRNSDKSELRLQDLNIRLPRVAKAQPWAETSERFQRKIQAAPEPEI